MWQIESSVRSLRAHNACVPIVLFAYGEVPPEVATALAPYRVAIVPRPPYEHRLAELLPRGWQALARYPVLHKLLNFAEIAAFGPQQVLLLDCDTLFFDDVDRLFARYATADCYAREEPTCRRSPHGYDAQYIDEDALAAVATAAGAAAIPPFNLGVVLLNHGIWRRLAEMAEEFVGFAWRLAVFLAQEPADARRLSYGEGPAVETLRAHFDALVDPRARRRALRYPSANPWILDEVAFWLTLGRIPDIRYADFSARDVLQNGEILGRRLAQCDWVVCHYFSQNMERLDQWIRAQQEDACAPARAASVP